MELENMSKDERSLLLFFECSAVDYGGLLQGARMNADDHTIVKRWNESGFVMYGRISSQDINSPAAGGQFPCTHWVVLSDKAWNLAHEERRARQQRMEKQITVERIGLEALKQRMWKCRQCDKEAWYPGKEIEVCDSCQRGGFLQTCVVCKGRYCLTCEAIIVGCIHELKVCKKCGDDKAVQAISKKYAPVISAVLKERDVELSKLNDR